MDFKPYLPDFEIKSQYDENVEIIDFYANDEQLTKEEKIEKLIHFRKNIENWAHTYSNEMLKKDIILEILHKKIMDSLLIENEDGIMVPGDLHVKAMFDSDWFMTEYLSNDDEYSRNFDEYIDSQVKLSQTIDSKYYLDNVLEGLKYNKKYKLSKDEEMKTSYSLNQTILLFGLLRDQNFIYNKTSNTRISEAIKMLAGFSPAQAVKGFSDIHNDKNIEKHKAVIIELLEKIISSLK